MMAWYLPVKGQEYRDLRAVIPLDWVVTAVDAREYFPGCDVPGVVRVCVAEDGPSHSFAMWHWRELVLSGQLVRVDELTGVGSVSVVSYCHPLYPVASLGDLAVGSPGTCLVVVAYGCLEVTIDADDGWVARVRFSVGESARIADAIGESSRSGVSV